MFASLSLLLCTISAVSAYVVPRTTVPPNWPTDLEDYDTYHCRYLANSCQTQHGTTFFSDCCHPLSANQSVSSLPSDCQMPSNTTCNDGLPSLIVDEGNGGGDCGDEPSTVPPTTTSTPPPADTYTPPASTTTPPPADTTSTPTDAYTPPPPPAETTPTPSPTTSAPADVGASPSTPAAKPVSSGTTSGSLTYGGFATYFYQGGNPGSCGQVNPDSAFICALDSAIYAGGSHCGQQVQITNLNNGQTVTVTVADECPTCDNAESIDLSVAAFQALDDLSVGTFPIAWAFV
ncbi:hypothetical protein SCLCIDRAFT_1218218 [Scleroderma citrinum Foug A]|uniref:RlpA-like protein double-psi beta-barrel domain-containing protein n=1 Tax=Scleroderma citrinum Foug A TaxID=1036808 RepID=A0A0C3DRN0_9AGAM|nr:hypothetical protein SCLCIDRAFT_1218218 [Scleroderma citrinum Foug A]